MQGSLNQIRIRTPEGVEFPLTLASPILRFLAWIIDAAVMALTLAILAIAFCLFGFFIGLITDFNAIFAGSASLLVAVRIIVAFAIVTGYAMVLEWFWRGQTVGKRALRLQVVDAQGLTLTFSQVAVRNLLRAVDFLPVFYFVGGSIAMLSSRYQRFGDIAANTIVVRVPTPPTVNVEQVLGGKYNSLQDHPHLCARLRQRISPTEAQIALQAIQRRDLLDDDARVKLFADIAGHLQTIVKFPEDTIVGMSDEAFIRACVDMIFRSSTGESTQRRRPVAGDSDTPAEPAETEA
jgi:uncharacterized RDD family membrane protein YckC